MKKISFGKLFDNRRFLIFFSLFVAVLAWFFVVNAVDTTKVQSIKDIPIEIDDPEGVLERVNLQIVDSSVSGQTADVLVEGSRIVVGGLSPSDILIEGDLSGITKPGTYDIQLKGSPRFNNTSFEVREIDPDTVRVRVDRMATKKFTVQTDIDGLQIPDGYIGLADNIIVSPSEVEISGPETDINKIDRCVVSVAFTEPLTATKTVENEIVLYDNEGNVLDQSLMILDHTSAEVTVQVLKQKWVPVVFDFLNVPRDFPITQLDYELDRGEILIAGPEEEVDAFKELNLGYVNVNEITRGFAQIFDVSLPSGFLNVDNVQSISVKFDTEDMEEATYTVTNLVPINVPVNYDVSVSTSQLTGVTIIGDPEEMQTLSASDLVAEIDLSARDVTPGPYNLPVRISAPNKGLVWAVGDYSAVVTITERE